MDYANQRDVYGVVMEPGPRAQAVVHIEYAAQFTGQGHGVDITAVSPCRIGALPEDQVQVDGCKLSGHRQGREWLVWALWNSSKLFFFVAFCTFH